MAQYQVLEPSFIDGFLVTKDMIDAAGSAGYVVTTTAFIGPTPNLKLIGKKEDADAEAKAAILAEAQKAGLDVTDKSSVAEILKALTDWKSSKTV